MPTRISFDNTGSDIYTIIEVETRDRPGLLYDLARTLTANNISIASAIIATYGEQAVDVFYVKDLFGLKLHAESKRAHPRVPAARPSIAPSRSGRRADPSGAPFGMRMMSSDVLFGLSQRPAVRGPLANLVRSGDCRQPLNKRDASRPNSAGARGCDKRARPLLRCGKPFRQRRSGRAVGRTRVRGRHGRSSRP